MLCSIHGHNEICTNRCPERPTCTKPRIPLLIEALDILASGIEAGESNGVFFTSFKSDCIAPEAYINNIVFEMQELHPPMLVSVKCHRPGCGTSVMMPLSQEEELMTDNYTKYSKNTYIYCSKECQERHLKKLAEAKSVASGSLKNHEYALVIHGVDVSKRLKEEEVHVISGNDREQQARCLLKKLESLKQIKNRRILTSNDVQIFLLKELPANITPSNVRIWVTAYEVMNKTMELYPDVISIGRIKKRSRYIELIK